VLFAAVVLVAFLKGPELALGVLLAEAVGFLQLAQQFVAIAGNDVQMVV